MKELLQSAKLSTILSYLSIFQFSFYAPELTASTTSHLLQLSDHTLQFPCYFSHLLLRKEDASSLHRLLFCPFSMHSLLPSCNNNKKGAFNSVLGTYNL